MKILPNMPLDRKLYPWEKWLDGQVREATQGVDFNIDPQSFRTSVAVAARRRGLGVRVTARGKTVVFQSYPLNEGDDT